MGASTSNSNQMIVKLLKVHLQDSSKAITLSIAVVPLLSPASESFFVAAV